MSAKDWWRQCVKISFERAGFHYKDKAFNCIFQRIYGIFGSHATYSAFQDAVPFLKWARSKGIITGVISNADERYGDSILPMLDLHDELDFMLFSKDVEAEKPSPLIFQAAMNRAGLDDPQTVLHIGDSLKKDYHGAKNFGMHAVLMDRFDCMKPKDFKSHHLPPHSVHSNFLETVEWITINHLLPRESEMRKTQGTP
eukprot:CAMPEP_0113949584 /NCGR_PEP_ID=MMETSP1339-20121228/76301_1 /TAXON_ID=94617 /ORGANISM="Fibrocapsa japonica" /LENGTH=197 /DNA_ID=CAMNT_0000957079 /DNA_START=147 /DNA_END=740 /DNA_ORIENTATION=- /assembly_acc=CAM_ASM_000762